MKEIKMSAKQLLGWLYSEYLDGKKKKEANVYLEQVMQYFVG